MISEALAEYEEEHEFARSILLPEEDRPMLSPIPWQGGYRWFAQGHMSGAGSPITGARSNLKVLPS
jgi:hypothetical protein